MPRDHASLPAPPLVVRCGAMGDMVMVTTLLRVLAARHGRPVDVLGSGAWTPEVLAACPQLGHLQLLTSRRTPYLLCPSQWAAVRWLRQRGRGPVYLCDGDAAIRRLLVRGGVQAGDLVREDAGMGALHGGKRGQSDFPHGRLPANERPPGKNHSGPFSVSGAPQLYPDRWLRLGQMDPPDGGGARALAAHEAAALRLPHLQVPEHERAALPGWLAAQDLVGPLVLLQPGNKRTHKRGAVATRQHPKYWPAQRWAALAAAALRRHPQARVLLCGSPREHGVLEEIREAAGDARVRNLAGALPIPRLFALLERAHSMVSVDTGPAHAAAALGCPLVVLFGAAPPSLWRPLGPGAIHVLGGERGAESRVDDIPAEAVIAAWEALPPRDRAPADTAAVRELL